MKDSPYIVGICGGSGSGKTYLLQQLMRHFSTAHATLISQDNYYRPIHELPVNEDGLINFDHPEAVNLDRLVQDLDLLKQGNSIELLEYNFNNPAVQPKPITYHPAPIMIIEGMFVLHYKPLLAQMALKIYIEADEHIKLVRRLKRDAEERGYPFEVVLRDYEKFVAPMYQRYVAPTRKDSDLIIPNNNQIDTAITVLVHHLKTILGNTK